MMSPAPDAIHAVDPRPGASLPPSRLDLHGTMRYQQSGWIRLFAGLPAAIIGLGAVTGPLWMNRAQVRANGGAAMLAIVGAVFLAASLFTTILCRHVEIDRSAREVREWYGTVLRIRERRHPLDLFQRVAVSKTIPMNRAKDGSTVSSRPRFDVALEGEDIVFDLQRFARPEPARAEACRVAGELSLALEDRVE